MDFPGFTRFDEDPFFEGHNERMRGFSHSFMNDLLLRRPDASDDVKAVEGATRNRHKKGRRDADSKAVANPMDVFGFGKMFGDVHQHMNDVMERMMSFPEKGMKLAVDGDNAHSYMQSSVYSYNNTGEGEPKVYEAHKTKLTAPGGVAEERKALKDSEKKLEKMRVSRRIKEREHAVEKSRQTDTNELRQHQDVVGMKDDEVEKFQKEWQELTTSMGSWWGGANNQRWPHSVEQGREGRPKAIKAKY